MLTVCVDCTTKYAPELAACPHCWSTNKCSEQEWERRMPKIGESGPTHTPGEEPEEWMPPVSEVVPESVDSSEQQQDEASQDEDAVGTEGSDKRPVKPIKADEPVVITPAADSNSGSKTVGKGEQKSAGMNYSTSPKKPNS